MITIKNEKQIVLMRQGGKILGQIFKKIILEVKPGETTGHLEEMALFLIKQAGGYPSFKGYQTKEDKLAFPTALCISINHEVVHAPSLPARKLVEGDIVGIDLGIKYPFKTGIDGYYTDMAATIAVGQISQAAQKLIWTANESLKLAIEQIRPGSSLNNIGKTIEQFVNEQGFSIVKELVGHGVGQLVHEEPQIPNYHVTGNEKIILKPGMTLAIEPMINLGDWRVKLAADGFTIVTADGSLSAHFEHTVLVTETGYEILTQFEN